MSFFSMTAEYQITTFLITMDIDERLLYPKNTSLRCTKEQLERKHIENNMDECLSDYCCVSSSLYEGVFINYVIVLFSCSFEQN